MDIEDLPGQWQINVIRMATNDWYEPLLYKCTVGGGTMFWNTNNSFKMPTQTIPYIDWGKRRKPAKYSYLYEDIKRKLTKEYGISYQNGFGLVDESCEFIKAPPDNILDAFHRWFSNEIFNIIEYILDIFWHFTKIKLYQ